VHLPGSTNIPAGTPVPILVDPKQPDYAEFPGHPFVSPAGWIALLIIAMACVALAARDALALRRMVGHAREHRGQPAAGEQDPGQPAPPLETASAPLPGPRAEEIAPIPELTSEDMKQMAESAAKHHFATREEERANQRLAERGQQWCCERNGHRLSGYQKSCPVDDSPGVWV
jgi:hypothetical protein